MAKFTIIIGATLGVVLVSGVILTLVAPKRISVTNTTFIHGSIGYVYDQLRFMRQFPAWSPFKAADPDQKFQISGPDGAIGATFSWVGVKEKSKGLQKVTHLVENKEVKIDCSITEPFQSNPMYNYTLQERNQGVEVKQTFIVDMAPPFNAIGFVMGLKNKISATNAHGLHLLKEHVENSNLTSIK